MAHAFARSRDVRTATRNVVTLHVAVTSTEMRNRRGEAGSRRVLYRNSPGLLLRVCRDSHGLDLRCAW